MLYIFLQKRECNVRTYFRREGYTSGQKCMFNITQNRTLIR